MQVACVRAALDVSLGWAALKPSRRRARGRARSAIAVMRESGGRRASGFRPMRRKNTQQQNPCAGITYSERNRETILEASRAPSYELDPVAPNARNGGAQKSGAASQLPSKKHASFRPSTAPSVSDLQLRCFLLASSSVFAKVLIRAL